MDKVVVTIAFMGFCAMQVCAHEDATDEEILVVCNSENPSGTRGGWSKVVREEKDGPKGSMPIRCDDNPDRFHFIVLC